MNKKERFFSPRKSLSLAGSIYAQNLLRAVGAIVRRDFNGLEQALCECRSALDYIERNAKSLGYSRQMIEMVAERKNNFRAVLDSFPEQEEDTSSVYVFDEAEKEYIERLLDFLNLKPLFRVVSKMSEGDLLHYSMVRRDPS
jgi:hypothetical protein